MTRDMTNGDAKAISGRGAAACALLWGVAIAACGVDADQVGDGAEAQVVIDVAPLSLTGVDDVRYALTVTNGADQPVMDEVLTSSQYGAGGGALTYVAPCDAQSNPHTVSIEILELLDADEETIPAETWVDPTPVSKSVTCAPNADTPASFDLTIARDAEQGFFDVAVNFEDIFCSAKLDCVDGEGPIRLLHNDGVRDTTMVLAWACAAGPDEPTWLYMDAVAVACDDGTRFTVAPGGDPGNRGGLEPYFFQSAVYRGPEQVEGANKCYWNTAVGVDADEIPQGVSCTLTAAATAANEAWPEGRTPSDAVYPTIQWEVPVVTDGALTCGQHAINDPGSGVTTAYTDFDDARHFAYGYACGDGDDEVAFHGTVCGTAVGEGDAVKFVEVEDGEVAIVSGDQQSAAMALPDGLHLADDCCQDLCCQ